METAEEEGERINPESIRSLVVLLQQQPGVKAPELALTPFENLLAEWREGPTRHFGVEFLPSDEARFVVFVKQPMGKGVLRLSGLTSVSALLETVLPHGVSAWVLT